MHALFRFYARNDMHTHTMDELVMGLYPDLVGVPVMPSTGLSIDDQPIFAEDILVLDVSPIPDDDRFWYSAVGQKMQELKLTEAVLHIKSTVYNEMAFELYLKKDGRFITHNEFDEVPIGSDDYESGNNIFTSGGRDALFIRYFCNRNPKIAGNTLMNPELLPEMKADA